MVELAFQGGAQNRSFKLDLTSGDLILLSSLGLTPQDAVSATLCLSLSLPCGDMPQFCGDGGCGFTFVDVSQQCCPRVPLTTAAATASIK